MSATIHFISAGAGSGKTYSPHAKAGTTAVIAAGDARRRDRHHVHQAGGG